MVRLIIVDDERGVRDMLADFVRQHEPEIEVVGCFSNGELAWAFLESTPVDMVITDIRMPCMSGIELAQHIAERRMDCVVCIISGYGEFEYARQAIEYGVLSYLLKPVQMRELSDALAHMMQRLAERRANALWESHAADDAPELFFADLMLEKIPAGEALKRRYEALQLPIVFTEARGFLLQVTAKRDTPAAWTYDTQRLFTAIGNVLRMQGADCSVQPIGHRQDTFSFVVLQGCAKDGDERKFDMAAVRRMMKDALDIAVEPKILARFGSLDEAARLLGKRGAADGCQDDQEGHDADGGDRVIANAKAYIAKHYGQDITRYDVANAVYMNSAYFSRYFKAKTGENFNDYLIRFRMQRAIELMSNGLKLTEVCVRCGYNNYRYFARVFRQFTTYTPSEYRQKVIRNEDSFDEL